MYNNIISDGKRRFNEEEDINNSYTDFVFYRC